MSLLTQSQLFSASTASYPADSVIEKDQFRAHSTNLNNCSQATGVAEPTHGKLSGGGGYHQLAGDESSNRKTNGRTNQTSRRCKKSKKSTNFDTSFKVNDDNQENKHSNKHPQNQGGGGGGKKNKNRNKNVNNLNNNLNNNVNNLDKESNQDHHQTNRKNSLNDRLSAKKMQRNSSSGAEEGYSSLDDCGSTSSANSCAIPESPDLIVGLPNDEERGDQLNEPAGKGLHHLHYRSHHHILANNAKKEDDNSDPNQSDDHLDLNSSDRSTVSSSDLNLMHNNEDLSAAEEQHFQQQDEFEQSTEQYLSSIWQQLEVGKGGYLTLQELFIVCEHIQMGPMDETLVKQLFDRLDEDKDGKVSFDELLNQLTSSSTGDSENVTSATNISSASVLNNYNLEEQHIESYANDYSSDYQLANNNSSNKSADNKSINEQSTKNGNNPTGGSEFDAAETASNKPGLTLALSPYSSYKNYFGSSSHHHNESSSFDKQATYDDEPSHHLKDGGDSVDHMTDSNLFYSLDSKLLPKANATSKPQRKSSFSAANAVDCLNAPSINSQHQQANSLSCCCSTLNNQSKSDYGFTNGDGGCSKVFCHKRTGSLGNAHPQTQHAHKHCNQYRNENCNELLNASSSSSNTSSTSGSSTNPSSGNEATVNQTLSKQNPHQTSSALSAISEQRSNLSELNSTACGAANCCCSNKTNKLLSANESGQGDGCSGKRGPIDKFSVNLSSRYSSPSSTNQSTPEIEHTQLLSSLNSMHQFNSSHSYHHPTSSLTKEHHLPTQQQANDEDICNLTGFGNLLSLDPFNYG